MYHFTFSFLQFPFPLVLIFFFLISSSRWTWPLCKSSFRRWQSGTSASPAPVHVRTASREGWVHWASWTTAWQRLAWTDRGILLDPFKGNKRHTIKSMTLTLSAASLRKKKLWCWRMKADPQQLPLRQKPPQPSFLSRTWLDERCTIACWISTSGPGSACWNVPLWGIQFPWW